MVNTLEKIINNSLFTLISWLIVAATSFVTAPLMINYLGWQGYGLWAAFFVLVGYLNLFDLGFGISLTKNVAQKKTQVLDQFLSLSLIYYFIIAVLGWLGLRLLPGPIFQLLRLPPDLIPLAQKLLGLVGVYFFLERVHLLFVAWFNGWQKMHLTSLAQLIQSLGVLIGTLLMVGLGQDLVFVIKIMLVSLGLLLVYDLLVLSLSGQSLGLAWPKWKNLKQFLSFGFQIQLTITLDQFSIQTFKLIITAFFGLTTLALYELAYRLAAYLKSLIKLVLTALFPAAAEVAAQEDKTKLLNLTNQGNRYLILITVWFYVAGAWLANDFFQFWLKQDLPKVVLANQWLLAGFFLDTVSTVVSTVLMSAGLAGSQLIYTLSLVSLNLGLGLGLASWLGWPMMLISYLIASLVATPLLWQQFKIKLGQLDLNQLVIGLLKTGLAAAMAGLVLKLFNQFLTTGSLTTFVIKGIVFSLIYFVSLWLLKFFCSADRVVFIRLMRMFRRVKA